MNKHCPFRQDERSHRHAKSIVGCLTVPSRQSGSRPLERIWKSKGNRNDYLAYRQVCRTANKEISQAKSDFYRNRIAEVRRKILADAGQPSAMYFTPLTLKYIKVLKSHRSSATRSWSSLMIKSGRPKMPLHHACHPTELNRCSTTRPSQVSRWMTFNTEDEVRKLISLIPSKSSPSSNRVLKSLCP